MCLYIYSYMSILNQLLTARWNILYDTLILCHVDGSPQCKDGTSVGYTTRLGDFT